MRSEDIENEYQRRLAGHLQARWGWSFMYTPESALERAKVVLIGLNPGGSQIDPPPAWEHTGVNAYVDQPWGKGGGLNPLQQQVGILLQTIGVKPDEVFAANLVPFKSPSWSALPDKEGALTFGRTIWRGLLARTPARLFVSLGKRSGQEVAALLDASYSRNPRVEWGLQSINEYVASDGRTVLALPHLSRFRIFGGNRTAAATAVGEVAQRVLR